MQTDHTQIDHKPRCRYPRRRLKGPIAAMFSARAPFPKYHIVDDCEGFASTPSEARLTRVFGDVVELGTFSEGRPCRMCALESVLVSVLDPRPHTERDMFVTFTSQANPKSKDASVFHYDWLHATESGTRRLRRLGRRGNLALTGTCSGVVAYGFVSKDAADVLAANLRTVVIGHLAHLPGAPTIEVLWTLLGDNPPELSEALGLNTDLDPWEVATLLTLE